MGCHVHFDPGSDTDIKPDPKWPETGGKDQDDNDDDYKDNDVNNDDGEDDDDDAHSYVLIFNNFICSLLSSSLCVCVYLRLSWILI